MTGEQALGKAQGMDPEAKKFIVRFWDGFDTEWIDVTEELDPEDAMIHWERLTAGGTKNVSYTEIDYYAIYPATVKMSFSEQGLGPQKGL